jgi:thioredoxin
MLPMSIQTFTDTNFVEQVEQYDGVVLVDFWAPWCVPCRLVSPIIEHVAQAFEGRARVGKLNVDDHPQTAARYHISGIPTVALFHHGRLVTTFMGVRPEPFYRRALEAALEPASAPAAKAKVSAKTNKHSVTIFSTPTCPWCTRLKAYLKQQHVAFKDVDVSRDEQAAQEMVRRSGQMGVPQAWIDGQVVVGFDRQRVNELLGLPAA